MKYLTILLALFVVLFLAGNSFFLVVIINCIVVGVIYPWWEEKYWNAPERVAKREKKREERERRKFEAVVSEYKVHIDKMLKDACDRVRQGETSPCRAFRFISVQKHRRHTWSPRY